MDLTDPSNPDGHLNPRGYAADIRGEPHDEDEGEFKCRMSFKLSWTWRIGGQVLAPSKLPTWLALRSDVTLPPTIALGIWLGSGAMPGTTATLGAVVAAILVATSLFGDRPAPSADRPARSASPGRPPRPLPHRRWARDLPGRPARSPAARTPPPGLSATEVAVLRRAQLFG
ncbi:hypothetical protein [Plantactinospora endophytica]|uniref:hypothetical protein n=1 Tax=Plantactinospora endophytica TaxID=673535 RepID=UPI0019406A46|nr:hypothetical protein [Plantactinospora endophytica]